MDLIRIEMELRVENLKVNIGERQIVKDISLMVAENQFVGLIGPNGSGKSTLLKAIYKVLKPQSGTIYLDKEDLLKSSYKTVAQSMSVVSQFNNMDFDFSVYDMVMMGRSPHKKTFDKTSEQDHLFVTNLIHFMDLDRYIHQSFTSLSGGEKQRVIFARALAQQPQFLVLDEPSNHLDIKYQLKVFSIIKALKISSIAAIHDMSLASTYCDIIYVIKDGEIVASGKPREVITSELIRKVYDVDAEIIKRGGNVIINYITEDDFL